MDLTRCDLHVHSRYSTDSGNFALRRARLGESYTDPLRVVEVCRRRGMHLVTITDHNTLEGALRIAHLPDTFLSVEVTTRFPEDDVPLHVLAWNLTEEDHRDLQPYRPSVYELQAFLAERGVVHALAHPLYRMGPPLTPSHVERLMLLFGVWEGRNGGRPREHNEAAQRLAQAATPEYLAKLAERHSLAPRHAGGISLTGGSDDHGALDIATTWTEAPGTDPAAFLAAVATGEGRPAGAHGSAEKLAHAVLALFLNAYREGGGTLPHTTANVVHDLLDTDADDAADRHREISEAAAATARWLAARAREGGLGLDTVADLGPRITRLLLAGALQAPFLATAHHHANARADLESIVQEFFGAPRWTREIRALVFTDTYEETNGVANTMRRLAARAGGDVAVVATVDRRARTPSLIPLAADWSVPLPTSEHIELRFPDVLEVLRIVEEERPDVVQLATPGPVGLSGLLVARLLGIPVVGAYHTELGPYALHLTKDLLVAEATGLFVDWFYGRCDLVLAPTRTVANALLERGVSTHVRVWGRGVDAELFTPLRRRPAVRSRLASADEIVVLSVGRLSPEKRLPILFDAFARLRSRMPCTTLLVVGDGPARAELERTAPDGTRFLGELHDSELADVYANADIFCFPSTTDTFGQVLLEAGASGLPVAAVAVGGSLDLVRHDETGLIVPPDDDEALARALERLARDEALRERLGARGRMAALERGWERAWIELRDAHRAVSGMTAADRPAAVAA